MGVLSMYEKRLGNENAQQQILEKTLPVHLRLTDCTLLPDGLHHLIRYLTASNCTMNSLILRTNGNKRNKMK